MWTFYKDFIIPNSEKAWHLIFYNMPPQQEVDYQLKLTRAMVKVKCIGFPFQILYL